MEDRLSLRLLILLAHQRLSLLLLAQSSEGFTNCLCRAAGQHCCGGMHSQGPAHTPKVFPEFPTQICQAWGGCAGQSTESSVASLFACWGGRSAVELGCLYPAPPFFLTKLAVLQTPGVGTNSLYGGFSLFHVFHCNRR